MSFHSQWSHISSFQNDYSILLRIKFTFSFLLSHNQIIHSPFFATLVHSWQTKLHHLYVNMLEPSTSLASPIQSTIATIPSVPIFTSPLRNHCCENPRRYTYRTDKREIVPVVRRGKTPSHQQAQLGRQPYTTASSTKCPVLICPMGRKTPTLLDQAHRNRVALEWTSEH